MPDPVAAPATPSPVPAPAPAAPAAPEPATLAAVKAARRGKTAPVVKGEPAAGTETGDAKPPAPAAAPPAPAAPPPAPPATAKIDMSEKELAQFTQLNKDVRETKEKLASAEARLLQFGKIEKARQLAKDGKNYDAIREAGFDIDAALAELLAKNPGQVPSPELLAIKREIDELKDVRTKDEQARTERTAAEQAASLANDRQIASKFVTENVAKYGHLAKAPELVEAAFKDFADARTKLQAAGTVMSGDDQAKLLLDALSVHEEKWARVFGAPPAPAAGFDSSQRAGVTQPASKLPERMTFADVKAARRAAGRKS